LRGHPGQNREGAASRSPAHVAMAVMHSRPASNAKADRAAKTSSAQFHVGGPADLRSPSPGIMLVAPFVAAETPLICVGSYAISGTSRSTWRRVSLLGSCRGTFCQSQTRRGRLPSRLNGQHPGSPGPSHKSINWWKDARRRRSLRGSCPPERRGRAARGSATASAGLR
jgi:hypothetical protein